MAVEVSVVDHLGDDTALERAAYPCRNGRLPCGRSRAGGPMTQPMRRPVAMILEKLETLMPWLPAAEREERRGRRSFRTRVRRRRRLRGRRSCASGPARRRAPAFEGERAAGRVLVGGDAVEELRALALRRELHRAPPRARRHGGHTRPSARRPVRRRRMRNVRMLPGKFGASTSTMSPGSSRASQTMPMPWAEPEAMITWSGVTRYALDLGTSARAMAARSGSGQRCRRTRAPPSARDR